VQFVHDKLADLDRRNFALAAGPRLLHHRAYRQFDLVFGNRALLQRAVETAAQLARIERLTAAITLDDRRQFQFDGFQRAEALVAGLAFAPTRVSACWQNGQYMERLAGENVMPRSWQRRNGT
jgi:hypothetical protein